MMITDDSRLGVHRLVRNRKRRGGSRIICIPTDGIGQDEMSRHTWEGRMEEDGQEVEAVISWKGRLINLIYVQGDS
jgi:hypothetical protein